MGSAATLPTFLIDGDAVRADDTTGRVRLERVLVKAHRGTFLLMNNVENLEKIAATLRDAGYTVEPDRRYYASLADRLRNAGFQVTAPDEDPDADKQQRDRELREENDARQAPAETGITPNGAADPAAQGTSPATRTRGGSTATPAASSSDKSSGSSDQAAS